MKVWDAPTRLFHWAVVLLVAACWVTFEYNRPGLHLLFGYAMLALLLFRLGWGFVGSETSRFGQFLRSPVRAFRLLGERGRHDPDDEIGHSAAGGWMVLVLLVLLAAEALTGLFTSIGPLQHDVGEAATARVAAIHDDVFYLVLAATALHLLALLAYASAKRHGQLRPMITGRKRLPGATPQPRMASSLLAALLLALAGCIVWVVVTRA